MNHEWHHDGYTVSTDPQRLDLKTIHGFLSKAYWSIGIPSPSSAKPAFING